MDLESCFCSDLLCFLLPCSVKQGHFSVCELLLGVAHTEQWKQ